MEKSNFSSEHFSFHQLQEGIYSAIANPRGAAFSNAGIIDLGDQTLIFDATMTPLAAQDLYRTAISFTHRSPRWVINSHAHSDHCGGNQIFSPVATIISTPATRVAIPLDTQNLQTYQENPALLDYEIERDRQRLLTESDPRWRSTLEPTIARRVYLRQSIGDFKLTLPSQTFEGKLIFYGSRHMAELRSCGQGHTGGDAILLLPEQKIAFIGDLGFFQCQPFMGSSFPESWQERLAELIALKYEIYVPGHGPLGSVKDLLLQQEYISWLMKTVSQAVDAGATLESLAEIQLPSPFETWQYGGMQRIKINLEFLHRKYTKLGKAN